MPQLTSELMVRLIDGVTKPAAGVARALKNITRAAAGGGATNLGNQLAAGAEAATKRLDTVRGQLFDAIAVGYLLKRSLEAPIDAAQRFETMLEDIGQKADIPVEGLGKLGESLKQVAADTNQSVMDIGASFDALVGMGAQADVALAAAGPIGQAATAYRAASEDLARASWSAVDNLKVPAGEISAAIDAMAKAGKLGAFELKDMAQYFPMLGAGYQALGQKGVSAVADLAAALQIVRKGTGDSASAATNLANVLQKMNAPATIAAFKKLGVDLPREMKKMAAEGMTPIEALAEVTNKALEGNLANLGKLFQDAQVQAGLRPLIQNLDEYRRIRDEAADSEGTVSADYARRMQTNAMVTKRWQNAVENLNITLGTAFLPVLSDVVNAIIPLVKGMQDFTNAHPQLVANLALATAGIVSFRVAALSLKFLGLWGVSGALGLLSKAFLGVGAAAEAAGSAVALQKALANGANYGAIAQMGTALAGIARIVPGLSLVGPALASIGAAAATISAPVWGTIAAVVAAVAAAGVLIWKYWDRISSIFGGVASAIGERLAPAFETIKPMLEWMGPVVKALGDAWKVVADSVGAAGSFLGSIFTQEKLSDEDKAAMAQAGADAANAVMDALKGVFIDLPVTVFNAFASVDFVALGVKIVADLWAGIQQKFAEFGAWVQGQLANFFKLPEIRFPWDAPAATPSAGGSAVPAMAKGGRLGKGESAIVGDGGEPELFTAGADGYVTPFSAMRPDTGGSSSAAAAGAKSIVFAPQFHNHGTVYGVADLDAKFREWEAQMMKEFEAKMAGTFSDPGVA